MAKAKIITRKLTDSSWLAQILSDKMQAEFGKNGNSIRYGCLHTLYCLIREADDTENHSIYYDNCNGKRQIIICEIPSLVSKWGTDFDKWGMQAKLRGLAERYTDDDGNYLVHVLTTHDLNSATVSDLSELVYQLNG